MIFASGTNVLFAVIQRVAAMDGDSNKITFHPEPRSTKICFLFRTAPYGQVSIYLNQDNTVGYVLHDLDFSKHENCVVTDMAIDATRIYEHLIK